MSIALYQYTTSLHILINSAAQDDTLIFQGHTFLEPVNIMLHNKLLLMSTALK